MPFTVWLDVTRLQALTYVLSRSAFHFNFMLPCTFGAAPINASHRLGLKSSSPTHRPIQISKGLIVVSIAPAVTESLLNEVCTLYFVVIEHAKR